MSVEFGASIKLDSNSATQQMKKFSAESKVASKALRDLQAEVRSTQEGLDGNVFRKYITASRTLDRKIEGTISKIHDQTVSYVKLTDQQKAAIAVADKLNQKYDDSAAAEARLIVVKKELRQVVAAGLKTQKEADAIAAREATRLRESTTLYKTHQAQINKTNNLRKEEASKLHDLMMKYDKKYAIEQKELKLRKSLNLLLDKGVISRNRYNKILRQQTKEIKRATTHIQKMTATYSGMAKMARLVSIYSRVLLGIYAGARLVGFIKDLEQTAEKIQLLSDKLEYLTGDSGAYQKLFDMTQLVGLEMEAANKIITRFAVVTDRAFSIDTMTEWAGTLVKSARATGTSTQEMSGALIQITQAMSAGRLMGDEYRSVTENLPLLTVALRDMFSKSELSLKELSSQGLITTDVLVEAFEKLKEIVAGFPDTTDTVEAALGRLSSSWDNFVAQVMDVDWTKSTLNSLSYMLNVMAEMIKQSKAQSEKEDKIELAQAAIKSRKLVNIKQAEVDRLREITKTDDNDFVWMQSANDRDLKNAEKDLSVQKRLLEAIGKAIREVGNEYQAARLKQDADETAQALRDEDKAYKEILRTQKLIEKIEKGKSIVSVKKNFDLLRRELESKAKLYDQSKPGGVDPAEQKRLYDLINQNEKDAIQKVIKTRVDGMLRLRGFKTKFDIDDIKAELAKNSRLLEIEKRFIDRKLQVESAVESRKIGIEQGVSPENLRGITPEEGEKLLKALQDKRVADSREEIQRVVTAISAVGIEADKTSAIINKDALGLLEIEKSGIVNDFDKSIVKLNEDIKKITDTTVDINQLYDEQYVKLERLRNLKIEEAERKLNEKLEDEFSKQTVALRNYEQSVIDLEVARKRLVVTDQEYLMNIRLINHEYEIQTAKVQSLSGEIGGLEQVYKGLEHGALNMMENTSTVYEFFSQNTEDLLDSSIGLIIDHSTSAQEAFKALVKSMLFELQKLIVKRAILQAFGGFGISLLGGSTTSASSTPFASSTDIGFSPSTLDLSIGSAKGNVFSGKGISAYSGSIINKPTLFPFASGVGLMGEDGSEAILPLKRGSDGKLGVSTNSGGSSIVINNYSNSNVKAESSTGSNGKEVISVIVEDAISNMVQNGKFDTMMSPYNISRVGKR